MIFRIKKPEIKINRTGAEVSPVPCKNPQEIIEKYEIIYQQKIQGE